MKSLFKKIIEFVINAYLCIFWSGTANFFICLNDYVIVNDMFWCVLM